MGVFTRMTCPTCPESSPYCRESELDRRSSDGFRVKDAPTAAEYGAVSDGMDSSDDSRGIDVPESVVVVAVRFDPDALSFGSQGPLHGRTLGSISLYIGFAGYFGFRALRANHQSPFVGENPGQRRDAKRWARLADGFRTTVRREE